MADRGAFDGFVAARSQALLRTAYLLTGDRGLAEDLLQTALTKAWFAWGRIDGAPEAYVRRVITTTYVSWWRRKWRAEHPTGDLPETPTAADTSVEDRDTLRRALQVLPPRQRAVVVLRYYKDLSEAQTADALGITVGTVKSQASKGLATLRRDPALSRVATDRTVDDLPAEPVDLPVNRDRAAEVHRKITASRRRRAAGVVLALLLVALAAAGLVHRLPGRPDALPTGVPPGPWFQEDGTVEIPGFGAVGEPVTFSATTDWNRTASVSMTLRQLAFVRCERAGALLIRIPRLVVVSARETVAPAEPIRITCSRPVATGYEGVLELDPASAARLTRASADVRLEPTSAGRWTLALLTARTIDPLPGSVRTDPPILDGRRIPDSGVATLELRRPGPGAEFSLECVPGVRLALSGPAGPLGELTCDPEEMVAGAVSRRFTEDDLRRGGFTAADGTLTVRSVGLRTDQWRLHQE